MQTKIDIRRAIIERGYKIPAFAEKCGMTPVNLRENIIKGNPTVKKLSEICEVLKCDITDLFYPIGDSGDAKENVLSFDKKEEEKKENTQVLFADDHSIRVPDEQPVINTTTFCPHCGAKVRVGVVLLPED